MVRPAFRKTFLQHLSRLIGWFFGTFWALLGALSLPHPLTGVGCALAVAIALIFLARLWRNGSSANAGKPLFRSWPYIIAVAAELLGMYTATLLLPRFGAKQQLYSAVGCIVGLHFVGLWLATRNSRFLQISAGMCCVSLLSMFFPYTWHSFGLRCFLLGVGNAIVLWLAASSKD